MKPLTRLTAICTIITLTWGLFLLVPMTQARELRISHQFSEADARHKLAQEFAAEVEKATSGSLTFKLFPSQALFKSKAQYDAMAKGALDFSVFPMAYASGKIPELDITLMPCIIDSIEEGMSWRNKEIGKKIEEICEKRGMKIITWLWYAGGIGSKGRPVIVPDDVKGLKFRAAGKLFEYMLNEAGASITSMASSEMYMALQTGVLNAGLTSAESFVSYRLYEQLEYFNTPEKYSIWYMAEPIVMSMHTWNSLSEAEKKAVAEVGLKLEGRALEIANVANGIATKVFTDAGVKVHAMTKEEWLQWRTLAEKTSWKRFADTVKGGQELLDLAK
ncbi:MAG: TRAP transporter substrate-binding protein DctP [Deltaproteobacteria bacterium]|nr:TRAP transporter substrate-binding protein DctP [Deltaproteobacteria bacterium]